jgi:transposase
VINLEEWMDIKQLKRDGHSERAIARMTGHTRKTVKRVLQEQSPMAFHTPDRGSCLDDFKTYVKDRHENFDLSAVRLLAEIQPLGYTGSLRTLRRYVQDLETGIKAAARATVRFETPPGQQGQVDWAECGSFVDAQGNSHPLYAFVFVLGYSRMLFVCFTASMQLPILMRCHMRAFEFFGGIPKSVLYDNMAQVRLPHTKQLHPEFVDFAAHYGYSIKTHRVRRPRTKGKCERMVSYVKDNFLNGRTFVDHADVEAQAMHWLDTVANVRVHETTGERPLDLLPTEKEHLTPFCSVVPYQICERVDRKVDVEGFVAFDKSRYSVDPEHVGKNVSIEAFGGQIVVRVRDLIIAEHERSDKPGACVVKKEHLERMWQVTTALKASSGIPHWKQVWKDSVAVTQLSVYEEVAA